jgi:cysteine synthase A
MQANGYVLGPTFSEMRDPTTIRPDLRQAALRARREAPLDPACLFDITWKEEDGGVGHIVMPPEVTGVDAPIALMLGRRFPTGSHKVGAVYSILTEHQQDGDIRPGRDTIVCPSTGNYGIGGAWVGPRMGYTSLVVLPEEMSAERFERIESYGATYIKTPGCESNVKEIFDKVWELRRDPVNRILEQFSEFGNYRFHTGVTGPAAADLATHLGASDVGSGHVAAFVSAMGSSGTIGAGDHLKLVNPACAVVGVEPVQCPTLFNVGFGGHQIEGIGDKHVTWIHNVLNMDLLVCVDDQACVRGLQLLQQGTATLIEAGVPEAAAVSFVDSFGISSICNLLASIKTVRALGLGRDDLVVTMATDGFDRYPSVMDRLNAEEGPMDRDAALRRLDAIRGQGTDWTLAGTDEVRLRWHNQKYFTWVEQQGKTVEELRAQQDPGFWQAQRDRIPEIDRRQRELRGF